MAAKTRRTTVRETTRNGIKTRKTVTITKQRISRKKK